MTETISATEEQTTTVIHRAFKFCLDPNERQEQLLTLKSRRSSPL